MVRAQQLAWANPNSQHRAGRAAAAHLTQARERLAALLGISPRAITFTSGATEANTWALSIPGCRIGSATEHPSVLAHLHEQLPVDPQGVLRLDLLEARLRVGGVSLVSVHAANNETGVLQPVSTIHEICRRHGVLYHCDAAQIPGRAPWQLSADLITLSAHKAGGPKACGALLANRPPEPIFLGGSQERGRRAGTVDVPSIAGMVAAFEASFGSPLDPSPRDLLESTLLDLGAHILGQFVPRLSNTTCALFHDIPGELLVMALDLEGLCASTGSACASGAAEQSYVLAAMGRSGLPLRLSLGPGVDPHAADNVLKRVIPKLRDSLSSEL